MTYIRDFTVVFMLFVLAENGGAAVSAADVMFMGLQIVVPLMNAEVLKVSAIWYSDLFELKIFMNFCVQLTHWSHEKFKWNFRCLIFKRILVIDGWSICCEIALIWMSLDFTDDHSTLVQVMAWCRQATSHYLSQCWPRSLVAIWCH